MRSDLGYLRTCILGLAAIAIVGLCGAERAGAQSAADKAAAEALFDRGIALMKEGKYQEACERLEQSQAVERGIGTMLYLAECYEKMGKTASAWALFREAASSAQAAGQTERADAGRRRAEKLEKGLSRLTIHVAPENRLPGMVVQDNGFALQAAVWSVAVPVDPGAHRVEVSAPGYVSWVGDVKVEDRGASTELRVPALVKDPNAVVAAAPSPAATGAGAHPAPSEGASPAATEPVAGPPRMSNLRITGVALGAAGVLGIGIGAIVGGMAMSNKNEVKDAQRGNEGTCPNSACTDKLDDARRQANASTALWAVGGALLVGGLVTFLVAPKYQEARPVVALYADPRGAALSLRGAF